MTEQGRAAVPEEAFKALFVEHYVPVLRYAERRVWEQEIAEDITADTFELAWARLQIGQDIDRPWLFRTASFKLRDHVKRNTRKRAAEAALERLLDEPEERMGTLDQLAVRSAVRSLSEREREVVMLTYWDGLSATESAAVLRCSTPAVWVALSRARTRLRDILRPEYTQAGGGHDER